MRLFYALAFLFAAPIALAQTPGSCEPGHANATLNASQVQATFFTTGTLFYGPGGAAEYFVPKDSRISPMYAASVWVGGTVGGEFRAAGATYGQGGVNNDYFEFWPGPLDGGATLPDSDNCSPYDRIWVVSQSDVDRLRSGSAPTADLREWPVGLGAPTVDANGDAVEVTSRDQQIDLGAGERPDLFGTQMAFWVMNDVGNEHRTTDSAPLGIEVAVTAFVVDGGPSRPAISQASFYRYQITNRNDAPIGDALFSFWADPDLGNAADDFVGVDVARDMAFVYNADEVDDGAYGTAPPALGVDILGGDATVQPSATSFVYFVGGEANRGDPRNVREFQNIMNGKWRDGTPITASGRGYNTDGPVTPYAFPGDPVTQSFWSEENTGNGRSVAGDRRFVLSSRLGTLAPGATASVDFAIVYGRGVNRLDSVTKLRGASDAVQSLYNREELFGAAEAQEPLAAPRPVAPANDAGPLDGRVELTWRPTPDADGYRVEISQGTGARNEEVLVVGDTTAVYQALDAAAFETFVQWRVRALRDGQEGPPSATRRFLYAGSGALPDVAVVEIVGPGGADPCRSGAISTVGCYAVGDPASPTAPGNLVSGSENGTGAYFIAQGDGAASLAAFAPNDYEIRVGDDGFAYVPATGRVAEVGFSVWDVGSVPPGEDNDPADDVRMVPVLTSATATGCSFGFNEPSALGGARATPSISAYYAVGDYAAFEALAESATATAFCPVATEASALIDFGRGAPIENDAFVRVRAATFPDLDGAVVRYLTLADGTPSGPSPTAGALSVGVPRPHPVTGASRVTIRTATPGWVRVTVVDLLGRTVAVLADGANSEGEHSVAFDATGLAAGVYAIVAEADGERVTRMVTVAR